MTATPSRPLPETLHAARHGKHQIVVQRLDNRNRSRTARYLYQLLIDGVNVLSVRSDEHALIYALPQFARIVAEDRGRAPEGEPPTPRLLREIFPPDDEP